VDDIIDVPVVPLADGSDAGGIRIGNEITYSPQQLPRIADVVPLVAGTRYGGAPGTTTTIVSGLIPLYYGEGPFNWAEIYAISHVMWFSENGMHADIDYCDDEEFCVSCTDWTFNEVNILTHTYEGEVYDGVKTWKDAMAFKPTSAAPSFSPKASGDTCGISYYNGILVGPIGPIDFGHWAGIGQALYEFGSKAGVAGVNFQVGTSDLWGDNQLTAPMLSNGQF